MFHQGSILQRIGMISITTKFYLEKIFFKKEESILHTILGKMHKLSFYTAVEILVTIKNY